MAEQQIPMLLLAILLPLLPFSKTPLVLGAGSSYFLEINRPGHELIFYT